MMSGPPNPVDLAGGRTETARAAAVSHLLFGSGSRAPRKTSFFPRRLLSGQQRAQALPPPREALLSCLPRPLGEALVRGDGLSEQEKRFVGVVPVRKLDRTLREVAAGDDEEVRRLARALLEEARGEGLRRVLSEWLGRQEDLESSSSQEGEEQQQQQQEEEEEAVAPKRHLRIRDSEEEPESPSCC